MKTTFHYILVLRQKIHPQPRSYKPPDVQIHWRKVRLFVSGRQQGLLFLLHLFLPPVNSPLVPNSSDRLLSSNDIMRQGCLDYFEDKAMYYAAENCGECPGDKEMTSCLPTITDQSEEPSMCVFIPRTNCVMLS